MEQFRYVSSGAWPATGLLAAQCGVCPCAQRDTLSLGVCKVKRKGGSTLFSLLQREVSPTWRAASFLLLSLCLISLSNAKIVPAMCLYPAGKVTCGQCCETPGGSCGCHAEMTYVKVTKYTQKLWRRKVWFQRKLSCASWDKWGTRLLAPRGSFHGTGLLLVSPESPCVRWRTSCLCLVLLWRCGYCLYLGTSEN